MRCATIERRVHRDLALRDVYLSHLRSAFLPLCMDARTVDCSFLQVELEPAQNNGVQAVRFHCRFHRNRVSWSVADVATLNDEIDAFLDHVSLFGLTIYWPC